MQLFVKSTTSGKPVIATRCGGLEGIVNDTNGSLMDVADIDRLAARIAAMATDWKHYVAQDIRDDFLVRFLRQAVVGQLLPLHQSVLGRG